MYVTPVMCATHVTNETCFIVTRLMYTRSTYVQNKKPNEFGGLVNSLPKSSTLFRAFRV